MVDKVRDEDFTSGKCSVDRDLTPVKWLPYQKSFVWTRRKKQPDFGKRHQGLTGMETERRYLIPRKRVGGEIWNGVPLGDTVCGVVSPSCE